MKKMRDPKWFYNDLYFMNFYFCPGYSKDEVNHSMKEIFQVDLIPTAYNAASSIDVVSPQGKFGIYIWMETNKKDDRNLANLAHECVHAANMLLRHVGVVADHTNDEAQAYLVAWIFNNCIKHLRK